MIFGLQKHSTGELWASELDKQETQQTTQAINAPSIITSLRHYSATSKWSPFLKMAA